MLGPGPAIKIHPACGATDMRKSFNGLYALVVGVLEADPLSGHLFVFCNRGRPPSLDSLEKRAIRGVGP